MKTRNIFILLTAAALQLFVSCDRKELLDTEPASPDGNEYLLTIDSEVQTKGSVTSVDVDLANLRYSSSRKVTAQLKKKSGTSWVNVTTGVIYSWSASSADSQKFSGSGTAGQACTISAISKGSGTMNVSASLSGSTVATKGVPVNVSDNRELSWSDAATQIQSGTVNSAVLNGNYSGDVTITSDNGSFLVGTSPASLTSSSRVSFVTNTTKTIYYKYTGSGDASIIMTARDETTSSLSASISISASAGSGFNDFVIFNPLFKLNDSMYEEEMLKECSDHFSHCMRENSDGDGIQSYGWNYNGFEYATDEDISVSYYVKLTGAGKDHFYIGYGYSDGMPLYLMNTSTCRSQNMESGEPVYIYPRGSNCSSEAYTATLSFYSASDDELLGTVDITQAVDDTDYELVITSGGALGLDTFVHASITADNSRIFFAESEDDAIDGNMITCCNQYHGLDMMYHYCFKAKRWQWEKCRGYLFLAFDTNTDAGYSFHEAKEELSTYVENHDIRADVQDTNCGMYYDEDTSSGFGVEGNNLSNLKVNGNLPVVVGTIKKNMTARIEFELM